MNSEDTACVACRISDSYTWSEAECVVGHQSFRACVTCATFANENHSKRDTDDTDSTETTDKRFMVLNIGKKVFRIVWNYFQIRVKAKSFPVRVIRGFRVVRGQTWGDRLKPVVCGACFTRAESFVRLLHVPLRSTCSYHSSACYTRRLPSKTSQTYSPRAFSTAATTFLSPGLSPEPKRATTFPSRSMRNLLKFQETAPGNGLCVVRKL